MADGSEEQEGYEEAEEKPEAAEDSAPEVDQEAAPAEGAEEPGPEEAGEPEAEEELEDELSSEEGEADGVPAADRLRNAVQASLQCAGRLWEARRGLILGGAAGLCLAVAAAGILWPQAGHEVARSVRQQAPLPAPVLEHGVTRTLEPFIFASESGSGHTIFKVGLAVEFVDAVAASQFDDNIDAARRDIYQLLSRSVEGAPLPAQKAELQEAVRGLLDARLGKGQVVKVYFREFLAV